VRLKQGGGEGGHNGLRSIVQCLGTEEFLRLRLGVGRPPPGAGPDVASWVLSRFPQEERETTSLMLVNAVNGLKTLTQNGLKRAQNTINRSK